MAQYEEGALAAGAGEMKTGKAAIAERKKKRREGQVFIYLFEAFFLISTFTVFKASDFLRQVFVRLKHCCSLQYSVLLKPQIF